MKVQQTGLHHLFSGALAVCARDGPDLWVGFDEGFGQLGGGVLALADRGAQHEIFDGDGELGGVGAEPAEHTCAVGETVILLHPPLPLVGVSMWMERGCQ